MIQGLNGIISGGVSVKDFSTVTQIGSVDSENILNNLLNNGIGTLKDNFYFFEDGDKLYIASNKGIVSTTGAVKNESYFIWKKGITAKKYLKNSGGKLNQTAGKSYLVLPNGKTKLIGFFKNPKVLPNSNIIVTKKEKKEKDGKFMDNFNQTFGLIASTITTILLASRL